MLWFLDDRVQWFRQLAARDRWREEVDILEEEIRRLIRGFTKMADVWNTLACEARTANELGKAAYASRRERFYRAALSHAWTVYIAQKLPYPMDEGSQLPIPEVKRELITMFLMPFLLSIRTGYI